MNKEEFTCRNWCDFSFCKFFFAQNGLYHRNWSCPTNKLLMWKVLEGLVEQVFILRNASFGQNLFLGWCALLGGGWVMCSKKTDRDVIWHCRCGRMSYGKFGEFVVEWIRSLSIYNSAKICVSGWIVLLEDICVMNEEMMASEIKWIN